MAEFTVDCLGEACPVPLMKVQKQMEKMAVGDVVIAQIDHSCAMKNIPEWARNNGHNVEIEEVDDGDGCDVDDKDDNDNGFFHACFSL